MIDVSKPILGIKPHTLYKAHIPDLTYYASKINPNYPSEQNYGQFLRVTVDEEGSKLHGQTWMIDTYHISCLNWPVGGKTDKSIEGLISMNTISEWGLCKLKGDCYYNASVELTENTAKYFTEFCDLTEVEPLSYRKAQYYNEEDIFYNVHLYFEHGYSFYSGDIGVTLIRKNAQENYERKLNTLAKEAIDACDSYGTYDNFSYTVKDFEKLAFEHRDNPRILDLWQKVSNAYQTALKVKEIRNNDKINQCYDQMVLPGFEDEDED